MMPLRTVLNNGDQVEIVTSKAQTPSPTWERFVVTGKARARIRRFTRTQQRAQFVDLGRSMLQKVFRTEGHEFTEKAIDGVLKIFKCQSADDLYALVGEGLQSDREVLNAVFPGAREAQKSPNVVPLRGRLKKDKKGDSINIRGLIPGMAVHYAGCCHPLPGDRIVGIVTTGKGVTIHTIDCDTLESFAETPERWLDVSWEESQDVAESRVGRINLVVQNEQGTLGALSTVIAKNLGNITNLKITNRTQQFWEMLIDIEVRDVKHLSNIIAALRATPAINSVERARG
jgi:GTP pyrophosphokinase